jgi:hypothetical protein
LGFALRFYGLDWDQGGMFNPDEQNIVRSVSQMNIPGQMNPNFFAYGGLTIYLYRIIAQLLAWATGAITWTTDWVRITMISRVVSASLSTVSIYLVFDLTRRVAEKRTALLAAFFCTCSVGLVQAAHFGTTETSLVFWMLLIGILCAMVIQKGGMREWIVLSIVCGLALATKVSAASLFIGPFLSWILCIRRWGILGGGGMSAAFVLIVLAIFCILNPYAILDYDSFLGSMRYEYNVVHEQDYVFYTLAFHDTPSYIYQFICLNWFLGPVIPTLGFLGLILWMTGALRGGYNKAALPFLAIGIVYFIYIGGWFAKFIRYMVPMVPIISVGAAWLINRLIECKKTRKIGWVMLFLSVFLSVAWVGSFMSIYIQPHTWVSASSWIYDNLPEGANILCEEWDNCLPAYMPNHNKNAYNFKAMTIYPPDDADKMRKIAQNLADGDYLVISSGKGMDAIASTRDSRRFMGGVA